MDFFKTATATAVALCIGTASQAALLDAPVADNAYITMNGFDWAWASPLAEGSVDLSFQAQFGWRLPTVDELLSFAPLATDFLFDGGNVPLGGNDPVSGAEFRFDINNEIVSDGACAAAYFSNFSHCDFGNGLGQDANPWALMPGAPSFAETLVVRVVDVAPVPLPGAAGLMLGGVGVFAAMKRRSKKAK